MNRHVQGIIAAIIFCILGSVATGLADQTIISQKVEGSITVDGMGDEPQWGEARKYSVVDAVAGLKIDMQSVYTDREIFFLISYPDPDESREHKTWVWNEDKQMYVMGPKREDAFVFKWNMESAPVDLSIYADNEYIADIWYWKACRTDPQGYADDKIQHLSQNKIPKSLMLTSKTGQHYYLNRKGDSGTSTYKTTLYIERLKDEMPYFEQQPPSGSRSDNRAKGKWQNGSWTIEFSRALNTGNNDDVQFEPGKTYQFGVSRYEIAGRPPELNASQPLFGSGDTGENLFLTFSR